jgi:hypothetical protein
MGSQRQKFVEVNARTKANRSIGNRMRLTMMGLGQNEEQRIDCSNDRLGILIPCSSLF